MATANLVRSEFAYMRLKRLAFHKRKSLYFLDSLTVYGG